MKQKSICVLLALVLMFCAGCVTYTSRERIGGVRTEISCKLAAPVAATPLSGNPVPLRLSADKITIMEFYNETPHNAGEEIVKTDRYSVVYGGEAGILPGDRVWPEGEGDWYRLDSAPEEAVKEPLYRSDAELLANLINNAQPMPERMVDGKPAYILTIQHGEERIEGIEFYFSPRNDYFGLYIDPRWPQAAYQFQSEDILQFWQGMLHLQYGLVYGGQRMPIANSEADRQAAEKQQKEEALRKEREEKERQDQIKRELAQSPLWLEAGELYSVLIFSTPQGDWAAIQPSQEPILTIDDAQGLALFCRMINSAKEPYEQQQREREERHAGYGTTRLDSGTKLVAAPAYVAGNMEIAPVLSLAYGPNYAAYITYKDENMPQIGLELFLTYSREEGLKHGSYMNKHNTMEIYSIPLEDGTQAFWDSYKDVLMVADAYPGEGVYGN